jgi:voltage-gated potassium channel Kch
LDGLGISDSIYFSFVTLATLGYGDITPANKVLRGIAVLECIIGQLYLALLIARLVGLRSTPPAD